MIYLQTSLVLNFPMSASDMSFKRHRSLPKVVKTVCAQPYIH